MEWAPDNAFYPTAAAVGLLRFTSQGVSRESMLTLRAEAADLFAESLIIDETQEIAHFNRGWLLLPTDAAAAERHFRRAAELVPDKGGVYLGRGLAGFEKGDREAALDGFALEIFNDPKFATAPFWDIPEFAPLRGPALRRAVAFLTKTEEGVEGLSPKTKAVMRDTALILADLASDEPPGPLLTSRSEAAVTVAKADPGSRTAAIEDHFFRQRHRFIHSDPLDAYEALFTRTGADPKAMLADPAGKEPPLMRQTQRERPGYGVLMRNLDVPLPIDAYVVQENAVVGDFFPGLFPPKGYLPTTVLMEIAATTGDALK
jgi:tetratricopeptide (TPR) repeat protein